MAKKIFVTGSKGFIGGHLAKALKIQKCKVAGFDIRSNPKDDVRDYERLRRKIKNFQPDGIIHLAAIARVEDCFLNPKLCLDTNLGGTANILEAVRQMKISGRAPWIIFGSSREVFGNPDKFPVAEDAPKQPTNIYAAAKLADETLCRIYSENYGLKTRVVRFSGVYTGLNDQLKRVIPRFIIRALNNQPLEVEGGRQFFDFVHIEDAVKGVIKCISHIEKSPELYNDFTLAAGSSAKIIDLAKLIIRLAESRSKIVIKPPRSYDVKGFRGDPKKVNQILGWEAKINLKSGLKSIIPQFKKSLKNDLNKSQ